MTKLSALSAVSSVNGTDEVYVVQGGVSKRATVTQVLAEAAITAIDGANVNTTETTTSSTYTDLATSGPSVTLNTGSAVIVTLSAVVENTLGSGNTGYTSVAVSGATTLAASDTNAVFGSGTGAGFGISLCRRFKLTGLTPGSNTFKLQYRRDGSTWGFHNRSIVVEAL